jgi:hypothetical protein
MIKTPETKITVDKGGDAMSKQRIVMTGLLIETKEQLKQLKEGFKKLGFGKIKVVGKFRTLPGFGGEGGRSDVVAEVENKHLSKLAVSPMHLGGGFSWLEDYYDNNRSIIPESAMYLFKKEKV